MNRLLKFVIFTVLAAALSVTALAQDVLPMPEYGAAAAPRANLIATYGPANDGEISVMSPLMWEDIGVESYTIKFKIIATGQVITWTPPFMCTPHCMNYAYPMSLFNAVYDGEQVQWWVVAKAGDTVFKSVKKTAFVNEVDAPFSLSPSGNNLISIGNIDRLMWGMSDLAVSYKVVVKNAETGSVVLKQTLNSNDVCDTTDDLCAFSFGGANPSADNVFDHSTDYKWFVVSTGVSGEKAKSPVARFSTAGFTD